MSRSWRRLLRAVWGVLTSRKRRVLREWAKHPCELANARMGTCGGRVEPYVPYTGGEINHWWCERHGAIVKDGW